MAARDIGCRTADELVVGAGTSKKYGEITADAESL
jgi:hypothetical protein